METSATEQAVTITGEVESVEMKKIGILSQLTQAYPANPKNRY